MKNLHSNNNPDLFERSDAISEDLESLEEGTILESLEEPSPKTSEEPSPKTSEEPRESVRSKKRCLPSGLWNSSKNNYQSPSGNKDLTTKVSPLMKRTCSQGTPPKMKEQYAMLMSTPEEESIKRDLSQSSYDSNSESIINESSEFVSPNLLSYPSPNPFSPRGRKFIDIILEAGENTFEMNRIADFEVEEEEIRIKSTFTSTASPKSTSSRDSVASNSEIVSPILSNESRVENKMNMENIASAGRIQSITIHDTKDSIQCTTKIISRKSMTIRRRKKT